MFANLSNNFYTKCKKKPSIKKGKEKLKNILIAGSPRSGKSLLSMEIKRQLPNLNLLCVDDLRDAIRATYHVDYRKKENEKELNRYFRQVYKGCLDFNKRYTDDGNTYFIIEGTNFTVEEVKKNYNDGSCLVIFVGKPQLTGGGGVLFRYAFTGGCF